MFRVLASSVMLSLVWAGPTLAQAPNVVSRETTQTVTVDRIERFSRVVTFRGDGNLVQSVYVDPSVKVFDELQTGDVVTVHFIESVIVEVRPEARLTEVRDTTEDAKKADDAVVQQLKVVVTVENVDAGGQLVTYRTNDNRRAVRAVSDPRLLEGVRPGDRIEVTLTRARAVSIERGRR